MSTVLQADNEGESKHLVPLLITLTVVLYANTGPYNILGFTYYRNINNIANY